jgi:ATP-dependent RNA helicase DDX51/DBP6
MVARDISPEAIPVQHGGQVAASKLGLENAVVIALSKRLGITSLFHMQAEVVSYILEAAGHDVVLCAPTGSGKTLAYCLPILSALSTRIVPRLRAVIVVPTRDLAVQVHSVVSSLAHDLDISVALAIGASSVQREIATVCAAEILIATPGRLLEHTQNSPGFSLSYVQFLVLDESDRLLQDSFYGWAETVIPACGTRPISNLADVPTGLAAVAIHPASHRRPGQGTRRKPRIILASATQTRNLKRLALLELQQPKVFVTSSNGEMIEEYESVIAEGDNRTERYSIPSTLEEEAYVLNHPQEKPIALLKLLGIAKHIGPSENENDAKLKVLPLTGSRLVFTNSVESAHRLARFLELSVEKSRSNVNVFEMSGNRSVERRAHVLAAVDVSRQTAEHPVPSCGKCTIVVCSDILARGMDISSVDAVINYDVPVHVNTYLHRVGRTARAGRRGLAITLLLAKQARHFKAMVRSIERGDVKLRIRSLVWRDENFGSILPLVDAMLCSLKRVLRREQLGLLQADCCLPAYTLHELGNPSLDVYKRNDESEDESLDGGCQGEENKEGARSGESTMKRFKPNPMKSTTVSKSPFCDVTVGDTLAGDHAFETDEDAQSGSEESPTDSFSDLICAQIAKNFLGSVDSRTSRATEEAH